MEKCVRSNSLRKSALMLEFGMPTLIENRTLEDNIALCKELGLSFIELNMNFPEYQIDIIEDIDWFYKKADEEGIYYTIHLDENLNVADFNPLVLRPSQPDVIQI